jgi:hypothetical protein
MKKPLITVQMTDKIPRKSFKSASFNNLPGKIPKLAPTNSAHLESILPLHMLDNNKVFTYTSKTGSMNRLELPIQTHEDRQMNPADPLEFLTTFQPNSREQGSSTAGASSGWLR